MQPKLETENTELRSRVKELECECNAMRRIVNEAKDLHQSFILMQTTKDDLQLEAQQARKELMRETEIKDINNARIKELQQKLEERSSEINRCEELLRDLQSKLCFTVCQNNQLKNEISQLLTNVNDYQQNYIDNDERTDFCQKEIEVCKENLTDLKDKLLLMKGLLQQKIEEYSQLETEFCAQSSNLVCLKEQVVLNEKKYNGEVCDLRCTIDDLQSKLLATEATCDCLREDYQRSQAQIDQYSKMERQLQKDFTNSLNSAQNEIVNLKSYVGQLKEECCCIKKELKTKEQQIGMAKAQIVHFKSSENSELQAARDEIHKLRHELDEVLQQLEKLKFKHEALRVQLSKAKQSAAGFERQAQVNEHHLHKCQCELLHLRQEKERLEDANEQIRYAYRELCEKYQHIVTLVPILNSELNEYKSKNENLLTESRNLINNVRAWLDNQAFINRQVSEKFSDDHLIIHNLSQKIITLERYKCRSRLHAGSNIGTLAESFASDISIESDITSQSFTAVDNSDEYSLDNVDVSDPFPSTWLKKVRSMTEELHRSSEYWESKLSDDYLVTKDK